ncbi:hypothetical protein FTUN_0051 [Frigoriglobus tundricola]|uniref:Uncharacterized protein n=1 Tax=Frigoriglobus tundricola TaxID=2774151 RepID=A0A6M5YEW4_9BACT|nr:hypothetical protein FTUN_0051 [Frigoriglobus tundricola]
MIALAVVGLRQDHVAGLKLFDGLKPISTSAPFKLCRKSLPFICGSNAASQVRQTITGT